VPDDVETVVAEGLSTFESATWTLPRSEVDTLVRRLVAWRRDAHGPVVVVSSPDVRPFFWRLLAGVAPGPLWVLSADEWARHGES
jgi:hypothetical protein